MLASVRRAGLEPVQALPAGNLWNRDAAYAIRCNFHHADLPLERIGGNVLFFVIGITRSSLVGLGDCVPSR